MKIRLQKYIADSGITSRRKAEELIVQSRVQVNDDIVTELGTKVDPSMDAVKVDGRWVDRNQIEKIYLLFNKPRGVMSTVSDPEGRKTVMDYCKEVSERIYPVGRLDYLSEGLLFLTNDGDLANRIMHPRYNVIKVYEVKVFGAVTPDILARLRSPVRLDGKEVKPKSVRVIKQLPKKTWIEFRLGEGKNREIRKICESHGLTVDKLRRVAIGKMGIHGIKPGTSLSLNRSQIEDALGLGEMGAVIERKTYKSPQSSVNIFKKKQKNLPPLRADDKAFKKFRKEHYFTTLKNLEKIQAEKDMRAKQEALLEKEKMRENRDLKREKNATMKGSQKAHPHAMIVGFED